ncbi:MULTISPECIES: WxL domain-containing protein [Bacillus cereus group]|uniref:WxL domain-containing protein n=1 Tax=Bacillus cereus group TaxID=86661 RepID=UPI0020D2726D|nr:WxL domain-containing protein [Bacillus thuringiensis]MCQ6336228.1 WxL domain-containing protein [Bacillus cereus]
MKKKTKQAAAIAAVLGTVALAPLSASADEKGAIYESNGVVEFIPNSEITDPVDPNNPDPAKPVNPVDPTNPDGKPNPGTNGPLSIDYASSLGQLSNETAQHKELTGSQIKFVDPTVASTSEVTAPTPAEVITLDPNGAESLVMSAKPTTGSGLWVDRWGAVEEMTGDRGEKVQKTKAISLNIPGNK